MGYPILLHPRVRTSDVPTVGVEEGPSDEERLELRRELVRLLARIEGEPRVGRPMRYRRGYEILGVSSVQEAVHALESFNPDVGLADGGLPDANGIALASLVRRSEGHRSVKIIAMSGDPQQEEFFRSAPDEYDAFLQKPFTTQELLAVLERLFRS